MKLPLVGLVPTSTSRAKSVGCCPFRSRSGIKLTLQTILGTVYFLTDEQLLSKLARSCSLAKNGGILTADDMYWAVDVFPHAGAKRYGFC